jgi:hypothetical protein
MNRFWIWPAGDSLRAALQTLLAGFQSLPDGGRSRLRRRSGTELSGWVEVAEQRVLLSAPVIHAATAALPTLKLTKATTVDAHSVTVSYSISTANVGQPLRFDIYRSDQPVKDAGSQSIGTETIDPGSDPADLAVGTHSVQLIAGTSLTPNAAIPYIIVVADGDGAVAEAAGSVNTAYFRTFSLGVVSHGLELGSAPAWEAAVASDLKQFSHDDGVIAFRWLKQSRLSQPGQAVLAGDKLYTQVVAAADKLAKKHVGDVVDLQFIAHSRGAVVVARVMQRLVGTTDRALEGSFITATLLDPHPANQQTTSLYSASAAGESLIGGSYRSTELAMADPQIVIPANVSAIQIYYQHSSFQSPFTAPGTEETAFNLWGQGPADGITNNSSAPIVWTNLTGVVDQTPVGTPKSPRILGAIGHSEVPIWYDLHVLRGNP